jgi:hypothetical protein
MVRLVLLLGVVVVTDWWEGQDFILDEEDSGATIEEWERLPHDGEDWEE